MARRGGHGRRRLERAARVPSPRGDRPRALASEPLAARSVRGGRGLLRGAELRLDACVVGLFWCGHRLFGEGPGRLDWGCGVADASLGSPLVEAILRECHVSFVTRRRARLDLDGAAARAPELVQSLGGRCWRLSPGLVSLVSALVTVGAFAPGARSWPLWVALLLVLSAAACDRYAPGLDSDWAGLSTRYGKLSEVDAEARYARAASVVRAAERMDAKVVLVPEGLAGRWTPSTETLWSVDAAESDRVLLIGALQERSGTRRNGLVIAQKGRARFWSQRWPAPIGMWAPWRSGHVQSALCALERRPTSQERRAAMLVCFEQFVSWPAFQTALEDPDVVLAPANLWFARGTNLNRVREVTLQSWGALMGWSVVEAING